MVLVLCLPWQSFGFERYRAERSLMGTNFVVVCYAEDRVTAERAMHEAFIVAENFRDMASDYQTDSELSQLSKVPAGQAVPISKALYEVLAQAQRVAEITDGAFDPTLGPLTQLWRESRRTGSLPSESALEETKSRVGWQSMKLSTKPYRITLNRDRMRLDLGGIGKGYVTDLMLESMQQKGITRVMIAAGGDIRLGDPPPGKAGWKVALQSFERSQFDEIRELANVAVSTSGDLYQSIGIDGIKYSHLISPSTGLGLTRRVAVTVIAKEGKWSDPLATAACVMSPHAVEKLLAMKEVIEVKTSIP